MLKKMKDLGSQVASKANDAMGGIAASVKEGAESLKNSAAGMSDALNEKAVRASTAQMCTILEIALEELKTRPLARAVTLTASVNIGIAALEMQIHLPPSGAGQEDGPPASQVARPAG
ncbi:MAG: hypothetical protein ACKVQA_14170 [Burkholderiales bacterium]